VQTFLTYIDFADRTTYLSNAINEVPLQWYFNTLAVYCN